MRYTKNATVNDSRTTYGTAVPYRIQKYLTSQRRGRFMREAEQGKRRTEGQMPSLVPTVHL